VTKTISGEEIPKCGITIRGQVEGFPPNEINEKGLQVKVNLQVEATGKNISNSLLSSVSVDGIWSVKEISCVKEGVIKLIAILKDKGGKTLSTACRSVTLLP
jgi:hypothetical protein